EVRVDDHPGRIQNAAQRRPPCRGKLLVERCREVTGIAARPDRLARPVDHRPGRGDRQRIVGSTRELVHRRKVSQLHGEGVRQRNQRIAESVASLLEMKRGVVVIGVLLLLAAGAAVARMLEYRDAAKPGVHVLGIDVGGKSRAQIEQRLNAWARRPVTIRAAGRSYHVRRGWLVSLDAKATANRALDAGPWRSVVLSKHIDVAPVISTASDASNVLQEIAKSGRPAVDATLAVHGTQIETTPARDGIRLDRPALLRRLAGNVAVVNAPY